uniref:hypothetical protein n=1 Tax=Gemmiger formicilis TaxID=745368 RepID=UPI003FEDDE75
FAARTGKETIGRGGHCPPVPVCPVINFPEKTMLRQVGGRAMLAPTLAVCRETIFYTFHNLLPKNFYKKSEKTV